MVKAINNTATPSTTFYDRLYILQKCSRVQMTHGLPQAKKSKPHKYYRNKAIESSYYAECAIRLLSSFHNRLQCS